MFSRFGLLLRTLIMGADMACLALVLLCWRWLLASQLLHLAGGFGLFALSFLATWLGINLLLHTYRHGFYFISFLKDSCKAFLFQSMVLSSLLLTSLRTGFAPVAFVVLLAMSAVYLILSRLLVVGGLKKLERRGRINRRVAIFGNGSMSHKAAAYFSSSNSGFSFQGFYEHRSHFAGDNDLYLSLEQSIRSAAQDGVNELYATAMPQRKELVDGLLQRAEKDFVRLKFIPNYDALTNRNWQLSKMGELPVVSFRKEPLDDPYNQFLKRCFDVVFSSMVILLLLSWLFPLLALVIRLGSKGPVLYRQKRHGRGNREFYCYKFRSMRVNAEADTRQAQRGDSRITRLGALLRKTSMDELPQFWNVLRGDMSVVGPRPHMIAHNKEYSAMIDEYMLRHFIKPGITGWAQVNGYRGNLNTEMMRMRVAFDIEYIENWEPWFDLKIIAMTLVQAIKGHENAF